MHQDSLLSPRSRLTAARLASDERLAKLVARGDDGAFGLLYNRYQRGLYRYCLWLLRHESDAEDALQCAFLAALQSLRRGGRDLPIRPWLFRIAHNEAISLVRRRRPEQQLPDDREPHTLPLEDQVEQRESLATLVADLRALPERQRAALLMRELSGLSHNEIALALGTSADSAKQSIFEARRSLQAFAEGRAMNCDEVCKLISDADGRMLRSRRIRAHVRHCPKCRAFAAAIDHRSRWLKEVPGLAPAATAGLLSRGLGGPISTGDAGGMAAGFGKALGVGVSMAIKTSAITTMAAIAVGTSIQLPHTLAHQTGGAAAMRSTRLVREASQQSRSHRYDPRTHHVAAAAAAVTRYSSSHTSQRPITRVHTKNGWLTPGVAEGSRPAGNPPPAQTGPTSGQHRDDDQNDNNQGGNKADASGASEQTGNRSSSASSSNSDQQGDNEQATGSAPPAQAQSASGQADSGGEQGAGSAPANTPPPNRSNPATTNSAAHSNPSSANGAASTLGDSSEGQDAGD